MRVGTKDRSSATIREVLRSETGQSHDLLDQSLGSLDLCERGEYALFLQTQLAARRPIEAWCAVNVPNEFLPPLQSPLIEADLRAMASLVPETVIGSLSAPPNGWLGVAWAVAGSSLGNRMMLKRLASRGSDLPRSFLGDDAMPAYFARIRPLLERPAAVAEALAEQVAAAGAVFGTFASAIPRAIQEPEFEQAA
ncbi:hypothetical protein A6F68_00058 [Tsuneonella dongtanensis]|uniref:Heme oxygenase n=1 Tax=Tsuneonella dongtanensis TaxID=692370 RepID=A0A1B2A939_9SPHN|nr:biliverdin-producing heme oxygenase [Tsuneonella dongtanensis]ANY18594.1 hypothetical protein A6F68_00058 [Tsuneonella dongtanensis]